MGMSQDALAAALYEAFPGATIEIIDLAGDNDHYKATITCALFKGKSRVQQHKMVYDALQGRMGGQLHALALTTLVPTE